MGWLGHGLYDGDDTFTTQGSIVEKAGFKKNVKLKDGTTLEHVWDLDPIHKLDNSVMDAIYEKWPKIEKKILKPLKNNTFKDEYDAIDYTMAADLFLRHKKEMPNNLQEQAVLAADYLINNGHADEFDDPTERKQVLRKFKEKLEKFSPVIVQKTVQEIKDEYAFHNLLTPKVEKVIDWLFDEKNKYIVLSSFESEFIKNPAHFNEFKDNLAESIHLLSKKNLAQELYKSLNKDDKDTVNSLIFEEVPQYYRADIKTFIKAFNKISQEQQKINEAADKIKDFEKEIEPLYVTKKHKM